jgi:hypothetical protein
MEVIERRTVANQEVDSVLPTFGCQRRLVGEDDERRHHLLAYLKIDVLISEILEARACQYLVLSTSKYAPQPS